MPREGDRAPGAFQPEEIDEVTAIVAEAWSRLGVGGFVRADAVVAQHERLANIALSIVRDGTRPHEEAVSIAIERFTAVSGREEPAG